MACSNNFPTDTFTVTFTFTFTLPSPLQGHPWFNISVLFSDSNTSTESLMYLYVFLRRSIIERFLTLKYLFKSLSIDVHMDSWVHGTVVASWAPGQQVERLILH